MPCGADAPQFRYPFARRPRQEVCPLSKEVTKCLLSAIPILIGASLLVPVCQAQNASDPDTSGPRGQFDPLQRVLPIDGAARNALDQLVRSAILRNPTIQSLGERIAQARGLHLQATIRPNPSLDLEADTDLEPAGEADRGLSVGFSHIFETAGKRHRRMNVAEEEITIAEYQLAESKRDLVGQLLDAYLEALVLGRNITNQQGLAEITGSLIEIVREQVRLGEVATVRLNQAGMEHSRVRAEIGMLEGRRDALLVTMRTLAGLDPGTVVGLEGQIEPRQLVLPLDEFLRQALNARPDLNAARAESNRVEAEMELLKAQRVPDITAFVRYSFSRSAFALNGLDSRGNPSPIRDLDHTLSGGITFQLPIHDRNQGNLAAAEARLRAARLAVRSLEASVSEEVAVAYGRCNSAYRSLQTLQDEVLAEGKAGLKILREAYRLGETPFSEVLNEQRRLFELQRAYNEVVLEYVRAAADLARASALPVP